MSDSERQLPEHPEEGSDKEVSDLTPPEFDEAPMTEGRDRKALASEVELNPMSLAGSWFHRVENGEIVWDGIVVGEPQPGKYLLQVRQGLTGLERSEAQIVMSLDKMMATDEGYEFRFYDDREKMIEAYAEYVINQEAGVV